jgi:ubiquinol-cytochrome c reductase cytochrome c1 subunit
MRFAKLALSSLAVLGIAAFGVSAIAQQPPVAPPVDQPAAPPVVTPAPDGAVPATPATPDATAPAEPAPVVAPAPAPAVAHAPAADHGEEHAAGGDHHELTPKGGWKHDGAFGTFDVNAMQRGFKVYKQVCSSCHGMKLLSFRNLGDVGGPFYDPVYPNPNDNPVVKKIASEFMVTKIDPDSGAMVPMPGIPADAFPSPYANAIAAAVGNGGAVPPDLSVIVKARNGGAGYVYSLLQGYVAPPAGLVVNSGQHYNAYFHGDTGSQWVGKDPRNKPPGGFLAMTPPLQEFDIRLQRDCVEGAQGGTSCDQNTFDDGTPTTIEQQAHDVAVFLAWASDPKTEARKQLGAAVIPFLFLLAILVFLSYRRIWRNVEH